MTPARSPTHPDLMALLCLIGGVVREAGDVNLLVQLMLISTYCPPLQHALEAWLLTEERYAHLEFEDAATEAEDGWDGEDEIRPGWVGRIGRVALWRHVTRFGLAVLIPIQWGNMIRKPELPVMLALWSLSVVLSAVSGFFFFLRGLAARLNHAYFVTIS